MSTPSRARSRSVLVLKILPRVVVLLLTLALFISWQSTRGRRSGPAALGLDPAASVVLTVLPGANYGEATVYLGNGADGQTLANDDAIIAAVRSAFDQEGRTEVLIQAAGSVVNREVVRVCNAATTALPAEHKSRVYLSLLPADSPGR
jgi:hypothetical protein